MFLFNDAGSYGFFRHGQVSLIFWVWRCDDACNVILHAVTIQNFFSYNGIRLSSHARVCSLQATEALLWCDLAHLVLVCRLGQTSIHLAIIFGLECEDLFSIITDSRACWMGLTEKYIFTYPLWCPNTWRSGYWSGSSPGRYDTGI